MIGRKKPLALVVGVLAVASLWWLIAPPRSDGRYREQAAKSAESLVSHLGTARLWARGIADGDATKRAATVGFYEASTDAETTAASFESIKPPEGQTALRTAFSTVAADAVDILSRMRIAAEHGDWAQIPRERRALIALVRRLDGFVKRARS